MVRRMKVQSPMPFLTELSITPTTFSGKEESPCGNHALATFQNGKQYNCDLSASYNIGARYLIREYLKTSSETERSQLRAKVPECEKRTSCTYATLVQMTSALEVIRLNACA
jgi:hypothetical protein